MLSLCSLAMAAQSLSSLNGLVTDPTGAVIPGASLTLKNIGTQAVRSTVSDAHGFYNFPQVQPGTYGIDAKASGFAGVVVNDVRLQINTPATVNISFEKVGTVAETISVSAESVQVNTTDASIGNAVTGNTILQLPSFARNVVGVLRLQPGVNVFGNVNGGKTDQANVTLDGIDVNDQMERSAFTSVLRVTLDSVQEFRTTTRAAPPARRCR